LVYTEEKFFAEEEEEIWEVLEILGDGR